MPAKEVRFCQLRDMEHSWIFNVFLGLIKPWEFLEAMGWGPAYAEIKIICNFLCGPVTCSVSWLTVIDGAERYILL